MFYEIRVQGHLDARWAEWFGGLELVNLDNGEAVISGFLADQAALHGVLGRIRDLNIPLLAVSRATERSGRSRLTREEL